MWERVVGVGVKIGDSGLEVELDETTWDDTMAFEVSVSYIGRYEFCSVVLMSAVVVVGGSW